MPNYRSYATARGGARKKFSSRVSMSRKNRVKNYVGRHRSVRSELWGASRAFTPFQLAEIRDVATVAMQRRLETKKVQLYNYNRTIYTSSSDPGVCDTYNVFEIGPSPSMPIAQGTGQGQRIGNKIRTKRCWMRGTFTPLPYHNINNPAPTPIQIKMAIFYDKEDPNAQPLPFTNGDFFQNGNGTKTFQNDLADLWSPYNMDRYRILEEKSFKLGYSTTGSATGSSGGTTTQSFYANNDFNLNANFSFDLTKYLPVNVTYNDGQTLPTSRGLFCAIWYSSASGGALGVGTQLTGVQYVVNYEYEDA